MSEDLLALKRQQLTERRAAVERFDINTGKKSRRLPAKVIASRLNETRPELGGDITAAMINNDRSKIRREKTLWSIKNMLRTYAFRVGIWRRQRKV